jgi:hypothetical protein
VVGAVVVRSGPHSTSSWDIWVMLLLGASLASFCGSCSVYRHFSGADGTWGAGKPANFFKVLMEE